MPDHIIGLSGVFGLGDPGWPVKDGLLLLLLRAGTTKDPLPGLSVFCLALGQGLHREGWPAGRVGATDNPVARGSFEDPYLRRGS